jgi:predicted MFS family arabinose efflux permease
VAFLLGPLVGGFLGQAVGIRRTILVAACLHAAFPVVVWFSPLRRAEFRPDDERPRPPP